MLVVTAVMQFLDTVRSDRIDAILKTDESGYDERERRNYRIPPWVRIGVIWLGESRNQNRSHSSTNDRKSSEV